MANQVPLSGAAAYPRFIWPTSTAPSASYKGAMGGAAPNDASDNNLMNGYGPGIGRTCNAGATGVAGGGATPGVQQFAFTYVSRI
jgi:hypothetical protein